MKNIRLSIAIALSRAVSAASHLTGHGGTSLPGKLALRVCPDLLETLSQGLTVVLVTGTNGKTTTTRMLEQMCVSQGLRSFSNPSGANLKAGLAAELLHHSSLSGEPLYDCAVLEVDEAVLHTVTAQLSPRAVIVTNIFRDQLDRFGEVTGTASYIREGLRLAPHAVQCLNADCMLTVSTGEDLPGPKLYFGINEPLSGQSPTVSDVPRCLRCGGIYRYRYHTYAHLGNYYCPSCGSEHPRPQAAVSHISSLGEDSSEVTFCLGEDMVSGVIGVPGVYNIYNAAAALAGAMALGLDPRSAVKSLSQTGAGFGRMEKLSVGSVDVRIILVKNPVGLSRALDYLCTRKDTFRAVFCLNDRINDGTDISWIWDADFDRFADCCRETGSSVSVAGTRAADMGLRLKYAGFPEDSISLYETMDDLAESIRDADCPVCVLPNYTAMLEIRERLAALSGKGRFWEEEKS